MDNRVLPFDGLLRGVHLATMTAPGGGGQLRNAAIAWRDGRIVWLGLERDLPQHAQPIHEYQGDGAWVTPGLIDCHTHLVYAGNRIAEWEQRLNGASYAEIAAAGGGIRATMAATRAASDDLLAAESYRRLRDLSLGRHSDFKLLSIE